ncbi:hypothetical protein AGMMS50276_22690 [Synergistales bacterium]|nr:hypothetical protein AGMMS50276_22660 [Synergistales bacterium]GHS99310.1 hypothetical protein AGMMS50276_22690 [Synergistales bacterium]
MDYKIEFFRVLDSTNAIALATAIDNVPNVRIVNFCYDKNRPEILYFASDRENRKVVEFTENNKVAFTTIPFDSSTPHVRSNNAIVLKSAFSIEDMKELFITKVPGYDEALEAIGETLDVFEVHVKEAFVTVDFENAGTVSF